MTIKNTIGAEFLSILKCPRSGSSMIIENDHLRNETGEHQYGLVDGIVDLRVPPKRLRVDIPWYEPWQELERLLVEYPPKSTEKNLPYHIDPWLASMVPEHGEGKWVLEVGCGERQAERWFVDKGFQYLGVDVDHRGQGPNILADGHNIPLMDSTVGYCASMAVLEHLVSPLTMAREVFRVLEPGGIFFGSAAFVYGFHDRASFHHMSHAGLFYVLRTAGFEVEQVWPDWRYTDSIASWSFRGSSGWPWRIATRSALRISEWSFRVSSNLARRLAGKPPIDVVRRDLESAGSISFRAVKPYGGARQSG